MEIKLYHVEITLLNPDGQVLANISTSDTIQKRMTLLFNEFARQIIDGSDKNWGE